jgi:hypothetical protein
MLVSLDNGRLVERSMKISRSGCNLQCAWVAKHARTSVESKIAVWKRFLQLVSMENFLGWLVWSDQSRFSLGETMTGA